MSASFYGQSARCSQNARGRGQVRCGGTIQPKYMKQKQREAERRHREDDAPRLAVKVPELKSLQVSVVDRGGSTSIRYKKLVVVPSAPALFVFPCTEPRCEEGGHDVTTAIMSALYRRLQTLEGDSRCDGTVGSAPCGREIHYSVTADYASPAS